MCSRCARCRRTGARNIGLRSWMTLMPSCARVASVIDHDAAGDRDDGSIEQRAHAHDVEEGSLPSMRRLMLMSVS